MLADTFFIIAFYLFKEVFCGFNNFLQCFDTYAHYVYQTGKIIFICLQPCFIYQAGFDEEDFCLRQNCFQRQC